MPGQVTGGTQRHFRTVAVSRPWRDLKGSAAPGLPGRAEGYPNNEVVSNARLNRISVCLDFHPT